MTGKNSSSTSSAKKIRKAMAKPFRNILGKSSKSKSKSKDKEDDIPVSPAGSPGEQGPSGERGETEEREPAEEQSPEGERGPTGQRGARGAEREHRGTQAHPSILGKRARQEPEEQREGKEPGPSGTSEKGTDEQGTDEQGTDDEGTDQPGEGERRQPQLGNADLDPTTSEGAQRDASLHSQSSSGASSYITAVEYNRPAWRGRDRPMDAEWLRMRGRQVQSWIDNPDQPNCPVQRCEMDLQHLRTIAPGVRVRTNPHLYPLVEDELLFPRGERRPREREYSGWLYFFGQETYRALGEHPSRNYFEGITAPGTLIIQTVARSTRYFPYISDVALTLYKHDQKRMESLRYIFVLDVVNEQTSYLLTRQMEWAEGDVFEHGSRVYQQIMGTRVGRMVGYLMLGAFERGTYRISRISTYSLQNLRFDIEKIEDRELGEPSSKRAKTSE
ncbi:hypothetical protein N7468_003079 [Penicillium chermesinum]|uniref:Uncharacterized protein n=1 Tax=Penicillium chermesinum TaxID=63820 RepID=A0A9W9P600_9EURO|nr:uncharacterized protein N7468_003079 [Penicillium chermesinum]KAJ5238460.1 hypothetical protein N7468_003079 [Penicillium chermesinum]KAJ6164118.1 hypothetical protein N7470_002790 [Penicillium chermesinum]